MALRSDVVGSLLRSPTLLEARSAAESGRLSAPEFKRIEDREVDEAVRLQESAGLDVVTDGELRRYAFFGHIVEALAGFDKYGGWAIPFRDEQGEALVFRRPVVVEKLAWRRSMCGEEFAYLRARASWTSTAGRSRSWCGSAAPISRSTRPSTRRCSIRSCARATSSAAAIPTG